MTVSPLPRLVSVAVLIAMAFTASSLQAQQVSDVTFDRIVLSAEFYGEGATFADIDGDSVTDVVSGPYWYAGPRFERRTRYGEGGPWPIAAYSDYFFTFPMDVDGDNDMDIVTVPMPGTPAWWYENPASVTRRPWQRHLILDSVGNESPTVTDLTGDGRPELVCIHKGAWGYAQPNRGEPTKPWIFTAISPDRGLGRFTHGLGIGDVNGDGRKDLLERTGWWEQPADVGKLFTYHAFPFAQAGGSQMFVSDFDGDGDPDVASVQNAHAWGLKWFERRGQAGDVGFVPHEILPNQANADGRSFNISQMHAMALADIDGDSLQDLVTGKRFYAHGGNDPGAHQLPVLYWFRTVRDESGGVRFEPKLIDKQAGVGTQLTVGDLNGDKRPDIVVGNKRGTTVFLNRGVGRARPVLTESDRGIGTTRFAQVIRADGPLTPEQEQQTFHLPPGFKAELVVSEPVIAKPMNIAFDARGRLWVSSSREYPYAAPPDKKPADTIKVLEDTNGDGSFDSVTTFADGLNVPIGLYPWRDGVVCFSIPNIWFLRDTDNDGRADRREKLFGPMGYERDTHGMCNAFTRGFDGWLYACHGFNNETSVAGKDGHRITMQSGNIFRMRLDGSRVEHFTHGLVNPFGMTFDRAGDQFVADCHTKPVSLLLHGGYYSSFGKPHDGLGFVPDVMNHLHGSTAIGGIAQATPGSFPAVFDENTFGGNVMTGRINRNSLHYAGSSVRAQEEPDFLVSGDPWFRPVDLQFGPDGALYVADFYNRIIGHYEVKLDHPGRDRLRGRVWRISYVGSDERRDRGARNKSDSVLPDLTDLTVEELIQRLRDANQTECGLISDRLVDHYGDKAVRPALFGANYDHPNIRIHSLWVLQRLKAITIGHVQQATQHREERVRIHAQRIVEAMPPSPGHSTLIASGLRDDSPLVRRAAAIAATVHRDASLIPMLFEKLRTTPAADVHLRHALRMAIRDHLTNRDWFEETVARVEEQDVPVLAGICLALKTEHAGEFLASSLRRIPPEDPRQFAEYLRFAARYVSKESVDELVELTTTRFRNNIPLQLELVRSVDAGLRERGTARPESVSAWAVALATRLLNLETDGQVAEPINWTFIAVPGGKSQANSWSISRRRNSADGQENSALFSSFPAGERETGIYRSGSFVLADQFEFYMAGHDGFPDKAAQGKNLVRLRDARTHATLRSWQPPRNDTAQRFVFDAGTRAGKAVYVELVDRDTANAYAWLAVGRFSEPRLNPGPSAENRALGLTLIRDLRLARMRDPLVRLIQSPRVGRKTINDAVAAVASFSRDSRIRAIAAATVLPLKAELRAKCLDAVVRDEADVAGDVLPEALRAATAPQQLTVANQLASDAEGAAVLAALLESGRLSPMLLRRPVLATKLVAVADKKLVERLTNLAKDLPAEDPEIDKAISATIRGYLNRPGEPARGQAVFTKHCAVCHQIGGAGKKVGPNLDGIGTRGLHRLVEDLLAPGRNIDVNFLATTVVTEDGQVHTGLLKPDTGAQTVLVNSEGKDISIPTAEVEDKKTSRVSPMPANIREKLTQAELRDLLAYLLGSH